MLSWPADTVGLRRITLSTVSGGYLKRILPPDRRVKSKTGCAPHKTALTFCAWDILMHHHLQNKKAAEFDSPPSCTAKCFLLRAFCRSVRPTFPTSQSPCQPLSLVNTIITSPVVDAHLSDHERFNYLHQNPFATLPNNFTPDPFDRHQAHPSNSPLCRLRDTCPPFHRLHLS